MELKLIHLDVLNRFPLLESKAQTVHVMKYIFPRQFYLQNVYTSDDTHPYDFKSSMFREKEIAQLEEQRQPRRPENESADADADADASIKVPKRLRGITELIWKLRNRNAHCCYGELLGYYCATEVRHFRFVYKCLADHCSKPGREDLAHSP